MWWRLEARQEHRQMLETVLEGGIILLKRCDDGLTEGGLRPFKISTTFQIFYKAANSLKHTFT